MAAGSYRACGLRGSAMRVEAERAGVALPIGHARARRHAARATASNAIDSAAPSSMRSIAAGRCGSCTWLARLADQHLTAAQQCELASRRRQRDVADRPASVGRGEHARLALCAIEDRDAERRPLRQVTPVGGERAGVRERRRCVAGSERPRRLGGVAGRSSTSKNSACSRRAAPRARSSRARGCRRRRASARRSAAGSARPLEDRHAAPAVRPRSGR